MLYTSYNHSDVPTVHTHILFLYMLRALIDAIHLLDAEPNFFLIQILTSN